MGFELESAEFKKIEKHMGVIEIPAPRDKKTKPYVENLYDISIMQEQTKTAALQTKKDPFEDKINQISDQKLRNLILAMYKAKINVD